MYLWSEILLGGRSCCRGGDIIIGIIGGFAGNLLIPQFGIRLGAGISGVVIDATIGVIVLLLITKLARGGGPRCLE